MGIVSSDGTTAGEVGDITYSSYDDVFVLFAACTACCRTSDDDGGEYVTRRTCHHSGCDVRRRTIAEREFHRYLYDANGTCIDGLVALNKSGEICWLNKSGGLSMEAGDVLECVRIAYERVVEWTKYIEEQVRKDEEKRNKDKRYVESTAENERYEVPVQPI